MIITAAALLILSPHHCFTDIFPHYFSSTFQIVKWRYMWDMVWQHPIRQKRNSLPHIWHRNRKWHSHAMLKGFLVRIENGRDMDREKVHSLESGNNILLGLCLIEKCLVHWKTIYFHNAYSCNALKYFFIGHIKWAYFVAHIIIIKCIHAHFYIC